MTSSEANGHLQQIAKYARAMLKDIPHDGVQLDSCTKGLWTAFCEGGESALAEAKKKIESAVKAAEKAKADLNKMMGEATVAATAVKTSVDHATKVK